MRTLESILYFCSSHIPHVIHHQNPLVLLTKYFQNLSISTLHYYLIGATLVSCLHYCDPINWYLCFSHAHCSLSTLVYLARGILLKYNSEHAIPLLKTLQSLPISPRQKSSPQGILLASGGLSSLWLHFLFLSYPTISSIVIHLCSFFNSMSFLLFSTKSDTLPTLGLYNAISLPGILFPQTFEWLCSHLSQMETQIELRTFPDHFI